MCNFVFNRMTILLIINYELNFSMEWSFTMKKARTFLMAAVPAISLFILLTIFYTACGGSLFGASGESPLKNNAGIADAVKVQETFRKVFEINKHRVVYISTEQTVKLQQNPFFNDPFFREFFGNPRSGPDFHGRRGECRRPARSGPHGRFTEPHSDRRIH